jgi:hypothetical protein
LSNGQAPYRAPPPVLAHVAMPTPPPTKVARGRFTAAAPGMAPERGDLAIYDGGPS